MVSGVYKSFDANDRSYFAIIKKEIHKLVAEAGFPEQKVAHTDIIVGETTSNLMKHALGGEILVALKGEGSESYLEIVSIDSGPGIKDVDRMMEDGVSTSSTMGHGLGSIRRLSDFFDAYSLQGWGTILLIRIFKDKPLKNSMSSALGALIVPKKGEAVSGDGLIVARNKNHVKLMLMDGLGHGADANAVIKEAAKAFNNCLTDDPVATVRYIHSYIRKTRGGVGTVLLYNLKDASWEAAGAGNIMGKLFGHASSKNLVPYNGIIGHNIPATMNVQRYSGSDFPLVILCSDGIKSRWDISRYVGVQRHDPVILATAIYKDYGRQTDDMSVIVAKLNTL
ncbi:ATP-binding protein [Pedobacter deserti]|uniref:ATP-binding protein n=1 Tax=Pedobacter deserti TaxID=2817382 RepID=UPI00210E9FE6|nr:ATP-binding protein [Pedobacter sp. SYSU D00382]